jgi:hypothetical protein
VVMLRARFDWIDATVTLASVGNINLRVCHSSRSQYLPSKRGVLGGNAPSPILKTWDWDPASIMVMHSDGLTSHWNCEEFPRRSDTSATRTASKLPRPEGRGIQRGLPF